MADKIGRKRQKKTQISASNIEDVNQSNSGYGTKRKLSRKEERRELRNRKKAKKHSYFAGKSLKDSGKTMIESVTEERDSKPAEKIQRRKRKKREKQKRLEPTKQLQVSVYDDNDDVEIEDLERKLNLYILDMCNAIETGTLKSQVENCEENDVEDEVDYEAADELLSDDGYLEDQEKDMNEAEELNFAEGDVLDDKFACGDECEDECGDEFDGNEMKEMDSSESESELEENTGGENGSEDDPEEEEEEEENFDEDMEEEKLQEMENQASLTEGKVCQRARSDDVYGGASAKYVPPHQRQNKIGRKQTNERLRKQVKGLLNRLSEANLSMVSGQMEELYMSNSRNDLNELLTDLIIEACISSASMPEGLLREHVMLIAVLNSLVGSEVGAFLLQKVVLQFQKFHSSEAYEGKEINNIVTLLAFLYSFRVIDCALIYDIFRELVTKFQEKDIELLLLLIRLVGVEVRRENPESLKEIILEIQAKAVSSSEMKISSRTRFMLETINALRNNNIRKIPNYDPVPVERARKLLKSLIGSNDNTKLSISLSDLLSADEKGRWWIVGSAWSEREKQCSSVADATVTSLNSNMIELSRQQRMNTDVRKNIFCTVMTSEDYVDAFEKLMRLKLKDKQTREIIHVLFDCALQEKSYNPFYSYLVQKFCEFSRSFQVTVQYSLWDRFKMASTLSQQNFSNMAHFLVHLLVTRALSLSVLKVVDFTSLDKKLVKFFTEMLTHLLLDHPESTSREVFARIAPLTQLDTLKESLKLFMKHFMKPNKSSFSPAVKSTIGKADKKMELEERIKAAMEALSGDV